MKSFLWNVLLASVWAFALGELSLTNLAVGFALGYAALWLAHDLLDTRGYCARVPRLMALLWFFLWELILANLRVARDAMTPMHRMRAGIIAVPLDAKTDGEITLLANLITLTPGTVSLGVSADRSVLYVYVMYVHDVEKERRALKDGFERRLLEALR